MGGMSFAEYGLWLTEMVLRTALTSGLCLQTLLTVHEGGKAVGNLLGGMYTT